MVNLCDGCKDNNFTAYLQPIYKKPIAVSRSVNVLYRIYHPSHLLYPLQVQKYSD